MWKIDVGFDTIDTTLQTHSRLFYCVNRREMRDDDGCHHSSPKISLQNFIHNLSFKLYLVIGKA
jgi:hypothetical protein